MASSPIRAHDASCSSDSSAASAGTAASVPQMARRLQVIAFSCGAALDCRTAINLASGFSAGAAAAIPPVVSKPASSAAWMGNRFILGIFG